MDESKSFWQQLIGLGAGALNNSVNAQAATEQSKNNANAIAGVVRFGIIIAVVYLAGKFLISLFRRK